MISDVHTVHVKGYQAYIHVISEVDFRSILYTSSSIVIFFFNYKLINFLEIILNDKLRKGIGVQAFKFSMQDFSAGT